MIALDVPSQQALAKQLAEELGEAFEFMPGDVSRYAELAQCFSKTFEEKGRIDAFCSNAGIIDQSSIYILQGRGKPEYVRGFLERCFC